MSHAAESSTLSPAWYRTSPQHPSGTSPRRRKALPSNHTVHGRKRTLPAAISLFQGNNVNVNRDRIHISDEENLGGFADQFFGGSRQIFPSNWLNFPKGGCVGDLGACQGKKERCEDRQRNRYVNAYYHGGTEGQSRSKLLFDGRSIGQGWLSVKQKEGSRPMAASPEKPGRPPIRRLADETHSRKCPRCNTGDQ